MLLCGFIRKELNFNSLGENTAKVSMDYCKTHSHNSPIHCNEEEEDQEGCFRHLGGFWLSGVVLSSEDRNAPCC